MVHNHFNTISFIVYLINNSSEKETKTDYFYFIQIYLKRRISCQIWQPLKAASYRVVERADHGKREARARELSLGQVVEGVMGCFRINFAGVGLGPTSKAAPIKPHKRWDG
ncbi:hypothetical protein NPIL_118871 [Nephila pilipes]|uniref:Uncharacterized protein n=1 Tax=Nephila pilipes TaxID=299642 RepID=A0A8X6JLF2_NEPPI|nr:hypothetical protein NPIL_118871 [Nephila pilipes]